MFLATLLLLLLPAEATRAKDADRFHFIAMGDAPYGDPIDFLRFSGLIHRINTLKPAFTVHVGDIKGGSAPCTNHRLALIKDYFQGIESALIYTPGDNEWTDCHRRSAGSWDPIERLAFLRKHYFSRPESLGQRPIPLIRQSDITIHTAFVENARWAHGGVGFVTAHVVGSHNNAKRKTEAARREFTTRDAASSAWITDGFAWAMSTGMRGLVIFIHGDPLKGKNTDAKIGRGFKRTVAAIKTGALGFKKPVLLVHGDFHEYKLDTPFHDDAGNPIANLTRLEVQGAPDVWATRVDVEPTSSTLFRIAPLDPAGGQSSPPD